MEAIKNIGKGILFISCIGNCTMAMASPVDACWRSSFQSPRSKTVVLTEDQDEGTQYFSFEKLEYGQKNQAQANLIRINKLEIDLSKIKWQFKAGVSAELQIKTNDVNTMLAEASKVKAGKIWYCLSMPFSGLGSSGNFAKYKVVLVIPKDASHNGEIFGVVGSNTLSK